MQCQQFLTGMKWLTRPGLPDICLIDISITHGVSAYGIL